MTAQTKNNKTHLKGFTLIELLVVIGILAILLAITLIAINPARQFGLANDTKRRSDATELLNSIGQYAADPTNSGNLPTQIISTASTSAKEINSTNFPYDSVNKTDLCSQLVTTYISALPVDPSQTTGNTSPNSASAGVTNCSASWDTGYQIEKDASNRITILAPQAYAGTTAISVTR
jgi:type IV pilus assembly protein PilA